MMLDETMLDRFMARDKARHPILFRLVVAVSTAHLILAPTPSKDWEPNAWGDRGVGPQP